MKTSSEAQRRQSVALEAIRRARGTADGADSVDLFVAHHLDELPSDYWSERLGTNHPEPAAVIDLLCLRSSWGEDDMEHFDFTLPADVTQYVLSVHFDGTGVVDGISMES